MPRLLWYFFLVPGLLMLAVAAFIGYNVNAARRAVEHAPGTVVRTWASGRLGLDFQAEIRFVAADGHARTFTHVMDSSYELRAGRPVTVEFDPGDPDHPRLQTVNPPSWTVPIELAIWGVVITLVGGIPLFMQARQARLNEWLKVNGRLIQADLTRVKQNTNLVVNGKSPWIITAHWLDPATRRDYNFNSENLWSDPSSHLHSKTIAVLVDPANPSRFWMDLSFLPKT